MSPSNATFNAPIEMMPTFSDGILFTFYAVAAIYLIFTAVIYYHWQQYGTNVKVNWITGITYLATTLPLMFIMAILAFTI